MVNIANLTKEIVKEFLPWNQKIKKFSIKEFASMTCMMINLRSLNMIDNFLCLSICIQFNGILLLTLSEEYL